MVPPVVPPTVAGVGRRSLATYLSYSPIAWHSQGLEILPLLRRHRSARGNRRPTRFARGWSYAGPPAARRTDGHRNERLTSTSLRLASLPQRFTSTSPRLMSAHERLTSPHLTSARTRLHDHANKTGQPTPRRSNSQQLSRSGDNTALHQSHDNHQARPTQQSPWTKPQARWATAGRPTLRASVGGSAPLPPGRRLIVYAGSSRRRAGHSFGGGDDTFSGSPGKRKPACCASGCSFAGPPSALRRVGADSLRSWFADS